ncbi:hypothetical protein BC936DRAFT_141364 [Jimgerdemannia flammicorona]|uniref:Uncharacterized protein n=1 Tax=Jimgerdemannia flammicorona TaxID=994334 RepID=A0A433A2D7_9FUNG|nr:hypothetical protein BC936DRAFT_141364 [Jimgerdemannia flammicorona]
MVQLAIWVLSGLTVASAIIIFGATIMNATRVRIMCSLASVCVLVLICLNVYWSEDPTTYIQRYPLAFAIFSPLYLDLVIVLFLDVGLKFHEALGMRGPDAWFYIIVVVAVANTIYDYTGVVVEHYYEVGPDMRWLMFVTQISIAISLALASALYALVPLMLTVRRKSAPNSHAFAVGVWDERANKHAILQVLCPRSDNICDIRRSILDDPGIAYQLRPSETELRFVLTSLPAPRVVIVKIRAILFDSQMRQRTGSSGGIGIRVSVNQRSAVPSDFDTITTDTYFPLSVISGESSPRRPIFELMSKDSYDSGSDTGGSVPPSPMKPFHQYGSRLSPVYEGGSEESYSDSTTVDSSRPPRGVAKNKVSPNLSAITVVTDDDEIYINPQNHFYNKSKPQRTSSNLSPYTSTPYGSNEAAIAARLEDCLQRTNQHRLQHCSGARLPEEALAGLHRQHPDSRRHLSEAGLLPTVAEIGLLRAVPALLCHQRHDRRREEVHRVEEVGGLTAPAGENEARWEESPRHGVSA